MVHTVGVADVIATTSPVVAVAVTGLYFAPPTVALVGAVEVTLITLFLVDTMKLVDVAVAVPSAAVTV
jgi:hypothetical protein